MCPDREGHDADHDWDDVNCGDDERDAELDARRDDDDTDDDLPEDTDSDVEGEFDDRSAFQDPGGNSALRAATKNNPRNRPCPTCGRPNMLTPKDAALHYQCDRCADRAERGGY